MGTQDGKTRQPIVVVMGHVDHGKTTLLDYIRKTNVASREAGGITQGIGAYEIEHGGKKITFIDTPGHEAFSKMRSRGAEVADIAILVVAGEEGVKPQTKEVIDVLQKTKTPFIVAINKIDKPSADIEKVKSDLASASVLLEGYGGNISWHGISAKTGEGVNDLLDLVVLASEMEDLKYDESETPEGFILETRMNKNRGIEASLIVRKGIIRKGDEVATPSARGKIRILEDFTGKQISEAPAGSPALILGLDSLPQTGEKIIARDITGISQTKTKAEAETGSGEENALRLVLKASDAGSLEALSEIIRHLDPERPLKILSESVGEVNENDLKTAISGGATIIGFKTKADKAAKSLAQARDINIVTSEIIYELVQAIRELFLKMDKPEAIGELEVLAVFNQQKLEKQVIGGRVAQGIFRKSVFEIKRGEEVVGTGRVSNLQSQKKDTSQVNEGDEAGLMVNSSVAIAVGDRLVIQANA